MIQLLPSVIDLQRRRLLQACGMATVAGLATGQAQARLSDWLPYRPDQVMRIDPVSMPAAARTLRIEPILTDFEARAQTRAAVRAAPARALPPLREKPPRAYVRTGERHGVEPWLLYGVALQESQLKFGSRTLPYPWTLCVRGRGLRYGNYQETLAALKRFVGERVTNVDCGAMQVNWHWHHDKLGSFERALDPYPNLDVGARILRGHYDTHRDWRRAVALYHTGTDSNATTRQRGARYASQTLNRLARMGVRLAGLTDGARRG